MKTLHLHIGTPKTATTSIQFFCNNNSQTLQKKGYCYPIFSFPYGRASILRNGHFLVTVEKNEDGSRCIDKEQTIYTEGLALINQYFQTYDHIILSDEAIWRSMELYREHFWDDLQKEAEKGNFRIHIIVYLRRQDKFLNSLWNQQIKHNLGKLHAKPFDEYQKSINKKIRFDYHRKLESIAAVIGRENITVRRFDFQSFSGGSIYADFLQTIGLTLTDDFVLPPADQNLGLYGNTAEIKRVLNTLPQMKDTSMERLVLKSLWACSSVAKQQYTYEMFSKKETEDFLKKYEEGNRRIAEEYLQEPDGVLFDNTINDIPKWEKDNPYMQEDLIRFVGTTSFYLNEENQKLKMELTDLRKELKNLKKEVHKSHPLRSFARYIKNVLFRSVNKPSS